MPDASRRRVVLGTGAAVLLALLASVDDRFFGTIPDGRQMLSSAVALSRWGELGVSSAWGYVGKSPRGGTYSRYGAAQSAVEVPAALAARALSRAAPGASSGPLFVLVPVLALSGAAAATAAGALALGASGPLAAAAGAALVFATPLWGYAGSDLSEPLQALLLASGLALALALSRARGGGDSPAPSHRTEWAAGLALGLAPLAKSSLWVTVAPVLLLALFGPGSSPPRRRRLLAGFVPGLVAWAALDLYRFGKLFGGYDEESFAYPPLAGLLRLTLLPNKGLLFYAPAVLLSLAGLVRLWREDRLVFWALALPASSVFATAAGWWAWDGQAGWGPRLVLGALPFLALAAARALVGASRGVLAFGAALASAGVLVNALGALQPFPGLYAVASTVAPAPIPAARAAGTPYEIEVRPDGTTVASAPHHLSLTPSWSPQRLSLLLLSARLAGGSGAARLAGGLGLDPPFAVQAPEEPSAPFRAAVSPFRWPFWGRSWLFPDGNASDPWALGLFDQAVRACDASEWLRAARIGREAEGWPASRRDPRLLALGAEGALRSGDADGARRLAEAARASAPAAGANAGAGPCHPWVLFVTGVEMGGDPGPCLPPGQAEGWRASAAAARSRGLTLTAWARKAGLL